MGKEEIINNFFNEYYAHRYEKDKYIFRYLNKALKLNNFLKVHLKDFITSNKKVMDINKITQFHLNDKIILIKNFYKKMGIDLDLDELINNGIVNIKVSGQDDLPKSDNTYYSGKCGNFDDTYYIDIYDNDLISDSPIWIHELSHYIDIIKPKSDTRELLTESLAFTDQFIFLNYLDDTGYSVDVNQMKLFELSNLYRVIIDANPIIKLFLLFDKLGYISKDNYKLLYGYDCDYDRVLDLFKKIVIDNSNNALIIHFFLRYELALALSIYMYYEYLKDNKFYDKINKLRDNFDKSLEECLEIIDINMDNFSSKVSESIESFINELKNGTDKTITCTDLTNEYFNELVILYFKSKPTFFERINDIYILSKYLKEQTYEYFKDVVPILEYNRLSKMNKDDKISLINDYYKYMGYDFRLDKKVLNDFYIKSINPDDYINNGDTFTLYKMSLSGNSYFENGKKVDVYDSNLLLNSVAWIHEARHYHNIPINVDRCEISYLLTESISFTEELMFFDYLEKLGYNYDACFARYESFANLEVFIDEAYTLFKMFSIYVKYGELNKSNYEEDYLNDEGYETMLTKVLSILTEDAENIFNNLRYSLACALSIYMYYEYVKDNAFITKINDFENSINNNSLEECLNIIGIKGLDYQSLTKIRYALDWYKNKLNKSVNEGIISLYDTIKDKELVLNKGN